MKGNAKFNPQQKKAITFGNGPLLIIAGAGTGKTMVITQRISHLILDKNVKTDAILALTFTDKAAGEMQERVDKLLPYGYVDLWISTFHSFCQKILEQHALDIGLSNDFKLLNQTSAWLLVRQNLDKFDLDYYKPLGNPTKFIHALLTHFSRCKDEEIYPEDYLAYAEKLELDLDTKQGDEGLVAEVRRLKEIANAYHVYQQLLLDNNAFDFGDLINYTLRLFKQRKNILQKYQKQFEYILVDEFQDTNFAQYNLVKLLAGERANLTVVADDDQSIYKFRGASVSNILQFKKDYPEAQNIVLTENYRSCQDILDLSYNFIQLNNPNRLEAQKGSKIKKQLKASKKCQGQIEHLHFKNLDDEVRGVINKILEIKKKDKEASWADFAILVRANDSATSFINFLRKTNLPYQFVALRGLYNKPIILDILNYFKLLDNYHESPALFRLLRSPIINISDEELTKLCHYANKKNISLYEALKIASTIFGIGAETVSQINFFLSLIQKHAALTREKTVGEVMLAFMRDSKYLEKILGADEALAKQNADYLNQFYNRLKTFEEGAADPSLQNFMAELDLELESGESGPLKFDIEMGPEVIKIMTVHSAKGLEFEYVFIPNLVEQRFPTNKRGEPIEIPEPLVKDILPSGDFHLQEERRLFYVAMTRAKKGLFFTSADDYGGVRKKKISQFLAELAQTNKSFKLDQKVPKATEKITEIPTSPAQKKQKEVYALPTQFSFSQITAFRTCPYQYKLAHIFKIPVFGKGVFSYGKSMHTALQRFFVLANSKIQSAQTDLFSAKISPEGAPSGPVSKKIGDLVSFEEIKKIFEDSWIDEWFSSKEDKEKYLKKGREFIKLFYDENKDKPLATLSLEKGFNIKMGRAKKLNEFYTIRGFIDRIDLLPDKTVELIDYKTGTPKDKLSLEEKTQLLLYQYACLNLPEITGGYPVGKLTFYYIDNNSQLSFLGSAKELEKVENEFIATIEEIKASQFAATPEFHKCSFCDFRDICEFRI
ncbi:MAG: UvrD-helicase domain-containing protein [Candidatus Parcubacteria bacterium]|nr:UvrD-helicase domain-containing protein [Candidatus Parcubacteria bacterium]